MNNSSVSQAVSLRQEGKTFREISNLLNIPLSTAHLWTRTIKLSSKQQKLIKAKHRQKMIAGQKIYTSQKKSETALKTSLSMAAGKQIIGNLNDRELLVVGAALYWAEGFKKDSRLGFANSDPQMIKLVLAWLINTCKVPIKDIRVRVGLNHQYQTEANEIEKKWSKLIGIPLTQFQKPFFQQTKWLRKYKNSHEYLGVLRIRANNQIELFHKIKGMVQALQNSAG